MNLKLPGSLTKKQKWILLFVIVLALIILIAGNQLFQKKKAKEKETEEVGSDASYSFIDANGKSYTFNLESKALKNTIDVKSFKLDGKSLYDTYGKVYKADLSGTALSDADSADLPQTKGSQGTHIGYLDDGKLTYDDGTVKGRVGIDVSYHQGEIDWKKVKKAGISFVYIRMGYRGYGSEGKLSVDKRFKENLKGAKAAGLDVGLYFFSQAVSVKEAEEEAAFVMKNLGKTKLDLPIVFDPEKIGGTTARTDSVSGKQFTKNTIAFTEAIKKAGYDTAVYANMEWEANKLDMEKLAVNDIPVWYADYEPLPQSPYKYYCWQYSATGSVDGISGNVDLDIQFEDKTK
jgi:GH25 family lysozyme M1 (1,4-beta-N-acetylmuramidase)